MTPPSAVKPLPLSRTCNLRDFDACLTVAAWQQLLAIAAWQRWIETFHIRSRTDTLVVNYADVPFFAPGPSAVYRYPGELTEGGDVPHQVAAIWALAVLDHIDAPLRFIGQAAGHLREHGLLFLTFAFWAAEGEDRASGRETRRRIYDGKSWRKLIGESKGYGFAPFGGHDWTYYGDRLGDDHTLASLVLTKTPAATTAQEEE